MTMDRDFELSGSESRSSFSGSKRPRKKLGLLRELSLMVVLALGLSILLKTFFIGAFWIPSVSMEPGLQVKDRIMVQKVSYWFGAPQRGEVVVFRDPNHWLTSPGALDPSSGPRSVLTDLLSKVGLYPQGDHLVKRVVAVEGDVVICCDGSGRITVNGEPINEQDYLADPQLCAGPMPGDACEWEAGPIPEGHLFVMGDNRYQSADSSAHMCRTDETECVPGREYVPVDDVVGRVFALVWPLSHFSWVDRADSFTDVPEAQ